MDFQVLKKLFKNYLKVNYKKLLLFVLIYISLFSANYIYFFNEKIEKNPSQQKKSTEVKKNLKE